MSDLLATYPAGQTADTNFREDGPEGPEPDGTPERNEVLNAVDWNTILADLRAVEADLIASFQGETTLALRIADIISRVEALESAGSTDPDAIHDNVAAEIIAVAEKAVPIGADVLLIEDSAAGNAKKRVQITNLPGGSDPDAIHDNVAAEISALTEKTVPIAADHILIEDSAAANVKKRIQIGSLPAGGGGGGFQMDHLASKYYSGADEIVATNFDATDFNITATPLEIPNDGTYNQLKLRIDPPGGGSWGAGGGIVQIGLYADNGSQKPGALITTPGNIALPTSGSLGFEAVLTISEVLTAGDIVWLAYICDITPRPNGARSLQSKYILGQTGVLSTQLTGYQKGQNLPLPDPFPATPGLIQDCPNVMIRRA